MQRFFLTEYPLQVDQPVDLTPLVHQLQTVLRLAPGAQIVLLDGAGSQYITEIRSLARRRASGWVTARQSAPGEPAIALTLYQCSLKADKFEWVLQKGVELGVSRFVPVLSQRVVVRSAAALQNKYRRWGAILREAAEQCGRGRIPHLDIPLTWAEAIAQPADVRLMAWEMVSTDGAPRITQALDALVASAASTPLSFNLLIGPEGGITPDEGMAAYEAGWQFVSLGQRILRAETAALASIAVVMEWVENLARQRPY
jgi:16S rRNA (uracil1498-N3)-methyltransferase